MATKLATERLNAEKKTMRKNPLPLPFYARMAKNPDGSTVKTVYRLPDTAAGPLC